MHAYVDESIRGREYLLCATLVRDENVAQVRRSLRGLRRGSQSRLHMAKESAETKKRLLAHVNASEAISGAMAITTARGSARQSRDRCLRRLTEYLVSRGVRRLVVESCDQDRQDVQVIGDALAHVARVDRFRILHLRPSEEPLLWMPDIIAWAYGADAGWRSRIADVPVIEFRV